MTTESRPSLPQPRLPRWQPLRLGLVELFHYDSEEFWFRDGHLLLRGNNGTGKSKVLSLTLPFLFDAQLKSSRIEPDGDPGKKMAWNLLLGRHERRMGYAWIEFGRVDADGTPRFLTLGCGLSAAAARPQVDSWFFIVEGGRIGQELWLIGPTRVVLTRERLRDALEPLGGQLFPTAADYRRAVDERLFHLGPVRYAALMDTLIQLRQHALSRLEEDRRELAEYEALERAVGQFSQRYQRYAATQARRKARDCAAMSTSIGPACASPTTCCAMPVPRRGAWARTTTTWQPPPQGLRATRWPAPKPRRSGTCDWCRPCAGTAWPSPRRPWPIPCWTTCRRTESPS